jgi:hypothetical protein
MRCKGQGSDVAEPWAVQTALPAANASRGRQQRGAAASAHLEAIEGRHLQQAVVLVHKVDLRGEEQSKPFRSQPTGYVS